MQMNFIRADQLADLLANSETLDVVDFEGQRTYVLHFDRQDILAIDTASGGAAVIYPCSSFDDESGGSVHDHARASGGAHASGAC